LSNIVQDTNYNWKLRVPAGPEVDHTALIRYISEQAKYCKAVLSMCTGTFLMHRAGLLSVKKATTHWNSLNRLKELGDVAVVEERFVRDGNVWSSAGVSAGIDLMLALIADIAGEEIAGGVQLASEYYPVLTRYGASHKAPMAPAYLRNAV